MIRFLVIWSFHRYRQSNFRHLRLRRVKSLGPARRPCDSRDSADGTDGQLALSSSSRRGQPNSSCFTTAKTSERMRSRVRVLFIIPSYPKVFSCLCLWPIAALPSVIMFFFGGHFPLAHFCPEKPWSSLGWSR